MKKALIGMALAAFVVTGACAQDQSTGLTDRPKGHHRMDKMQQLNLTDEQKTEVKSINEDLQTVREQVEGLETHLRSRQEVLEQLRREIEDEKASR